MNSPRKPAGKARGIRQTMSELHIWTGLLAGWLLYAMFLTGTVSYFRDELSAWMRPELPAAQQRPDPAEVAQRMIDALGERHAPGSAQWSIGLPTARNPAASAFWRGGPRFKSGVFDAATGNELSARDTRGGDFFYTFHFNLHYIPTLAGRWIVGLCAMFMLVAIVSGVITHKKIFADFFTFRQGKGQRSWLDAHAALSVLGLPFHFMITYSGLVMLVLLYMPWGADSAFKTPPERQALFAQMSALVPAGPPSGTRVPLAPVGDMFGQAETRWGKGQVGRVTVNNPGDAAARVVMVRGEDGRVSVSPRYLVFDGTNGRLLQEQDAVGPAAETRGVLYALHLGRFGDTVLRWLYFLVSLAGTAMVGTGLVLWTVKRRAKLPDPGRPYFGFRLVERLNIAAIAGLSVAMAAFLWGNRLLPRGVPARADWEIHLFFIAWALAAAYTAARPPKRAWVELLWLACALLALLPVLNALVTPRGPWRSLAQGDWVYAGMDLALWALAMLHAALAWRTARHKPRGSPRGEPARARAAARDAGEPAA